jgi:methionine synthase I (cobalamin-dependent)
MNRLLEWLRNGPLIADGAWGTELQSRGLALGETPDLWNLAHPDRVQDVAKSYVDAGSQVILTNTFRANAIALAGHAADIESLNRAGVEISRRAAAGRARVVASIGPTGKMLMTGEVTEQQVADAFGQQALALASAGAEALLIETMSDLQEALIALKAAQHAGLPVIVSFAFDTGKQKDRTMMGETPEKIAAALQEAGAAGVGANCGAGAEFFPAICSRLRDACELPVWIKPNAGLPEVSGGRVHYHAAPEEFAERLPALLDAGACFVGGCCGSNPEFVRALAAKMKQCATS